MIHFYRTKQNVVHIRYDFYNHAVAYIKQNIQNFAQATMFGRLDGYHDFFYFITLHDTQNIRYFAEFGQFGFQFVCASAVGVYEAYKF